MQLHVLESGTMPCPGCHAEQLEFLYEDRDGGDVYQCLGCLDLIIHEEHEGVCGIRLIGDEQRAPLVCDFDWMPRPNDVLLPY